MILNRKECREIIERACMAKCLNSTSLLTNRPEVHIGAKSLSLLKLFMSQLLLIFTVVGDNSDNANDDSVADSQYSFGAEMLR